jgi:hypothetical protein
VSVDKTRRAWEISHLLRSYKEVLVMQFLADEYREPTKECSPTLELIVLKTKLSRSSVERAIAILEEDQFLEVHHHNGGRLVFTLKLDRQLELKPGPKAVAPRRKKRNTGFRLKPFRRGESEGPDDASESIADAPNRSQAEIGDAGPNRSQAEIGGDPNRDLTDLSLRSPPISGCDHHRSQAGIGNAPTPFSVPGTPPGTTATAAPRPPETAPAEPGLLFPIAMKPPRPPSEQAKLAEAHRIAKLQRRVAGHAVGIMLDPHRLGLALIQEPVISEALLIAATKERCGRKGIHGYEEVLVNMCASVWWRHTIYGKAVIAKKAPRPRDLPTNPRRGDKRWR